MAWKGLVSKVGIAIGATAMSFASAVATAGTSSDEALPQDAAWALVEEYRELRRNCADLTGDERKSCFHELHANNGEYRLAKQQLRLGSTEDRENIHLVTF